jgi:uncharacterized membrane protein
MLDIHRHQNPERSKAVLASRLRPFATWRSAILAAAATLLALVAAMTTTMLPAHAAEHMQGTSDVMVTGQPMSSSGQFGLQFRNYYQSTVNVAVMYRDFSGACDDYGGWATAGWWQVARGETVHVLNTTNRYVYFYADAEDGTTWTDEDASIYVPANGDEFDSCRDIGSTASERVGLDEIDMGSTFATYTVNLHR